MSTLRRRRTTATEVSPDKAAGNTSNSDTTTTKTTTTSTDSNAAYTKMTESEQQLAQQPQNEAQVQPEDPASSDGKSGSSEEQASQNNNNEPVSQFQPGYIVATLVILGLGFLVALAFASYGGYAISFGLQYLVFLVVAWPLQTEKYYDLTGSFTYCSVVLYTYIVDNGVLNGNWDNVRCLVMSVCILIWTIRLGSFLFARISGEGGIDKRFNGIRDNFSRFLFVWTFQGMWVFFNCLPLIFVNSRKETDSRDKLKWSDFVGWFLWVFGFGFEVLADHQKSVFKETNPTGFINVGLWAYSRHPNYFGEIVLWIGLTVSALSIAQDFGFLVLLSPLSTMFLLIFVSGLPPTEARADKKYGSLPEYQEYKKNTPVLIPFFYCWN